MRKERRREKIPMRDVFPKAGHPEGGHELGGAWGNNNQAMRQPLMVRHEGGELLSGEFIWDKTFGAPTQD